MFVIHDEKFKEILFAGIYRGPNEYIEIKCLSLFVTFLVIFPCTK